MRWNAPIHQSIGVDADAVIDFQIQIGGLLGENASHQVVHPERTIHKALQAGAPCLHRVRGCSWAIHRKDHQEPCLHTFIGFLHQRDLGGRGDDAVVARARQGAVACRLGIHVVAERTQIAADEGFQEEAGRIFRAFAGGPDIVCRKALGPHLPDMSVFLRR